MLLSYFSRHDAAKRSTCPTQARACSRVNGDRGVSFSRWRVSPTGTTDTLPTWGKKAARSSMVFSSASPSFQPGTATIWQSIKIPASENRRSTSMISAPRGLPRSLARSAPSVAWTEMFSGLMRSAQIRSSSRAERLVQVM